MTVERSDSMPSNRGTLFWLAYPGNLDGGGGELVILSVDRWGTDYLVPPLMNGAANLVRVLASEDETWVRIDDGLNTARFVLNAGEFFEDFYGASIRVTSNRPVLVGQFGVGSQQPPTSNARDPI